jgi:triose/dihydroxyacetone kinase / FAD-AMP lyase (cyclizing)
MLFAAVCGNIFASPTADAVYAAIRSVSGPAGCVLVVMNYTGDRLNFGMAAERAQLHGIPVEVVLVADDCGVPAAGIGGPRGLAGTIFVHKVRHVTTHMNAIVK